MPQKRSDKAGPISERYADWLRLHENPPEILYHYTTADGLLPMLQSGRLWATNNRYMNDPKELRYATAMLREVVASEVKTDKTGTLKDFSSWLTNVLDEQDAEARVYIACFCTDGDLLSQWRAYGAFGGGYALGFDSSCLSGPEKFQKPPYRILRKVVYDPELQRDIIRGWLKDFIQPPESQTRFTLLRDFNAFLSECLSTFKDPSYCEEDEWRLIQFGRDETRSWEWPAGFRARNGKIIPYADLDLTQSNGIYRGKLPVRSIVHGPTLNPDTARRSLELLCASRGFNAEILDLQSSRIPFEA